MSKTIKCTNPTCNELIPIPEGTMQVICSNCNTWHFPPTDEPSNNAYQESPPGDQYYASPEPPVSQDVYAPEVPVPPPIDNNEQNRNDFWEPEPEQVHDTPATNEGANKTVAYLVTDSGVRLALKEGINVIGRKNTDLVIEDRTVSRRHCVIEITQSSDGTYDYFIYDIGHMEGSSSTNGVFVSGRTLRLQDYERVPLTKGTALQIGKVNLVLQTN
jgi:FOG: FHA domain